MRSVAIVVGICLAVLPELTCAQSRTFTLVADDSLQASGLLGYLIPRFALKHGLRPTVVTGMAGELAGLSAEGDVVLADDSVAARLSRQGLTLPRRGAFHLEGGDAFAVAVMASAQEHDNAQKFADWLISEIGQRTVAAFEGPPLYVPGAALAAPTLVPVFDGDPVKGEDLSHQHCGRCHVVSAKNRMGGIGSTPSFPALRALPGWQDKFMAFWTANPHPVFVQIEGVTEPFNPDRPPHVVPVTLSLDEADAILAYVASIKPLDLGPPLVTR